MFLLGKSENGEVEPPVLEVRPLGAALGAQVAPGKLADTLCYQ